MSFTLITQFTSSGLLAAGLQHSIFLLASAWVEKLHTQSPRTNQPLRRMEEHVNTEKCFVPQFSEFENMYIVC